MGKYTSRHLFFLPRILNTYLLKTSFSPAFFFHPSHVPDAFLYQSMNNIPVFKGELEECVFFVNGNTVEPFYNGHPGDRGMCLLWRGISRGEI